MKYWFLEFITILAHSKRTLFAITIGMIGYITIPLMGRHMLVDIHSSGLLAPMIEMLKEKLLSNCDKEALGFLVSTWLLAIQLYRKDKKRFYRF